MPEITADQRAELERRGWRLAGEQWRKCVSPPAGDYRTGAVWWGAHTESWVATGHMSLLTEFAAITSLPIPGYVVVPLEVAAKALPLIAGHARDLRICAEPLMQRSELKLLAPHYCEARFQQLAEQVDGMHEKATVLDALAAALAAKEE